MVEKYRLRVMERARAAPSVLSFPLSSSINFEDYSSLRGLRMNSKHKILIVDDEPLNVKLMAAKLPPEQYETILAYGGSEALEKVATGKPDLVLLDIMMPGMDGYEVTRRIKSDPARQNIPVILVTALDGTDNKIKGLEAGADEFLNKPVNTAELLARIRSLVSLKKYQEKMGTQTNAGNLTQKQKGKDSSTEKQIGLPTILLVEDDEKDSKLIRSYLHGEPYQIRFARDGEEAMSCAQQEDIDLILLDILLPGMDGFEVCRRLKQMEETRNIQIVVITSLRDLESKVKGIELGADDYLVKPINVHELRVRMKALIKKKAYLDSVHAGQGTSVHSAITDKLTGLYNYGYFKHFLELEVERSQRYGHPVALVMIDIDDFSEHNAVLGHLAGDDILRQLGALIKKNTRGIDAAARYGGEEFVVVLPETDVDGAIKMAERIRQLVFEHTFFQEESSVSIKLRISVGIAVHPADAQIPEEMIRKAESALSEAKKKGKDNVHACEKSTDVTESRAL
jgi:two-component system cell cycle response regulator